MKHKHAELIKAWADGAVIEQKYTDRNLHYDNWETVKNPIWSDEDCLYRIKLEPKPDVIRFLGFSYFGSHLGYMTHEYLNMCHWENRIKLTFEGETGKLKSAEVIK